MGNRQTFEAPLRFMRVGRADRRQTATRDPERKRSGEENGMKEAVLAIGGSDPSGGAGIQGDLKTLHQHGVYGAAAITLLTVQSTRGVTRVEVMDAELLAQQVDAVLGDLDVRVIKTGALGSDGIVRAVAARIDSRALVCDPVMLATSGAALASEAAAWTLASELVSRAAIVTPNAIEASSLTGLAVLDVASARDAARSLVARGAGAALVKGGHLTGELATDVLCIGDACFDLSDPRLDTRAGHGTGCALASSIAARLAKGETMLDAVRGAKRWVHRALAGAPGLGHGRGPLDLFAPP
jgi:hydroxymethylpyrimidine/phosphomethylpyrimidine kinase